MARRSAHFSSAYALCVALLLGSGAAHAQPCLRDADCPDGYGCDLPPTAGACDSSSGTCSGSGAKIAPSPGQCEPKPLRCEADSDCPKGLTCDLRSGSDCDVAAPASGSAGGAAPAEPATCQELPSEGECVHELTPCTKDSECDGGEVCTPLGSTSECSGSAGSPTCAPGAECEAPAAPPEEQCTETQHFYCFPPPKGCSASQPCASGTRCVQLPDDASDHPPPGWEGLTALCLPEDWALVLEGRVHIEGGGSEDSASAESSSAREDAKSAQGSAGQGAPGDTVPEDDGCAVREPGTGSGGMWPPALALGLVALLRRRRARR